MNAHVQQVFDQARALSEDERHDLVNALLESFSPSSADDLHPSWDDEIAQRIARIESGESPGIPWEEVAERLFGGRHGSVADSD